ncbi:MAG: N-acetyltransferase [Alphaproteobacteria bacterium]|nr:N-acetyltransferase [Alphaproteobacteria bacterium]
MATLATPRLRLRLWRDDDLPAFAALNGDARVMAFFPGCLDRRESDALAARIRAHFDRHGFGAWAVAALGVAPFIGFVGLTIPAFGAPFMPSVEIGWRLAAAHWGQGYATEAARAALAHGFGPLGLAEIVSFTASANMRSRRLMERLGMRHHPGDDFDHPALPEGHPLRRHALYRLARPALI